MFRFNFNVENDSDVQDPNVVSSSDNEESKKDSSCILANEVVSPENSSLDQYSFKPISVESSHFMIRNFETEGDKTQEDEFLSKFYSTCDVTPSVYEGGLKIWECTYDLLLYLIHNDIEFRNKTVLDLGCGCGILGIYAAQKGAKTVHFHDYNIDVLKKFTIPNVTKNEIKSSTTFVAGDWSSFCDLDSIQNTTYDYILSSETLYNTASYSKLSGIFSNKLKKNDF
ncbi:histidine protein methyltransferase 1 homolog isoform X2 [Planococcus citri]|uniref:histidine protein methyltransferase 1 homolog isoform X2 n=1 Tax=Planococcus citri TaxID=170843 RepID=UPI0031FA4525